MIKLQTRRLKKMWRKKLQMTKKEKAEGNARSKIEIAIETRQSFI